MKLRIFMFKKENQISAIPFVVVIFLAARGNVIILLLVSPKVQPHVFSLAIPMFFSKMTLLLDKR